MAISESEVAAIAGAVKAAVPQPQEWCFANIQWESLCMPRGEMAAWVQAAGAILALAVAVGAPMFSAYWDRRRMRRGYLALLSHDLATGRLIGETYINSKVRAPAYRLQLHGLSAALPALVADGTLNASEAKEVSNWYIDATSFNYCLDLTSELRRDGGEWKDEVSRNLKKAEHLVPSTVPSLPSRYDEVNTILTALSQRYGAAKVT